MSDTEEQKKPENKGIALKALYFFSGCVVTAIVTALVNFASGSALQNKSHVLAIDQAAQIAAYQSFQNVAFDFEERGRMFILAQEGQPDVLKLQKQELLRSISKQISAAEKLRPYVQDQTVLSEYMDAALVVQKEVESDLPFVQIKPFWNASQNLIIRRAEVVKEVTKKRD